MVKKDKFSKFDTKYYDLYKNGYFSDESYLVGRYYYDNVMNRIPSQTPIPPYRKRSGVLLNRVLSLGNFLK